MGESVKGEVAETAAIVPEISLIIPEYRADVPVLFQNLSVINAQTNFNFRKLEVIVVDDFSGDDHKIPLSFYQQFTNLSIHVLECTKNGGPGVARQIGIDHSTGRYVMFADADDCLASLTVLASFSKAIEDNETAKAPFDILITEWDEEVRTAASYVQLKDGSTILAPDRYSYSRHSSDFTWMHGKLYRRQFLVDEGVRFDDLRVHEDRRFNIIAFALSHRTMKEDIVSYIWKYHPHSITREGGAAYSYNSIATSVDAAKRAYDELLANHPDRIDNSLFGPSLASSDKTNISQGVVQTIFYTYFIAQSWIDRVPDRTIIPNIESHLGSFYISFKDVYDRYPVNLRYADFSAERDAVVKQMGPFIEKETLPVFLWRISARNSAEAKESDKEKANIG
jgi:glycosyltransferase involved in cell wall biosynthesis